MGGQTLAKTEMEKDVKVCVNRNLKLCDYCKKNSHESDSCAETNTKELSLKRQKSAHCSLQEVHETSPRVCFSGLLAMALGRHFGVGTGTRKGPALSGRLERYYLPRKMQGSRPGDTRGKEKMPGHDTDIQDFERNRQSQGGNIIYKNEYSTANKTSRKSLEETLFTRMSSLQRTRQAENPWNMTRKGSRMDIRQNSYGIQ
jgi:hypothetical protein